jgi:hypothetical protein
MQKNINQFARITFLTVANLLLCACIVSRQQQPFTSETASPSLTYTIIPATLIPNETFVSTVSPTQTSTPVPTLVAHEWIPIEPLIAFGGYGGDGGCGFEGTLPIYFTLLSNGELFVLEWNNDLKTYEIKSTTLSRQNTCNLVNSIDQAGFFSYDPSTYISDPQNWWPPIMGSATTHITVQAWRSNSVDLYGLHSFINRKDEIKKAGGCGDCPDLEFPTILPSIRKTFQLLENYQPPNLEIYQSQRIGLWIDTYAGTTDTIAWSLKSVKLSKLVFPDGSAGNDPNIILTGATAKSVYELFNHSINVCGMNVIEGDKVYRVFARPLLPNEYLSEPPIILNALSCTPSDGWVEIP